jgi:hypothetical protein
MSDKCKSCDKVNETHYNTLDNTLDNKLNKIIEMVENLNLNLKQKEKPVVVDLIKLYGLKPVSEYDDYNEVNN